MGTILAAVGLAATTLVTTGGAASAATRIPDSELVSGGFQFLTKGRIANAPGNAHSGTVGQAAGDGDYGSLLDWNCPAGVTPPSQVYDPQPTKCKLLRAVYVGQGYPYSRGPGADWNLRTLYAAGTHTDNTNPAGEALDVTINSNYTVYGTGRVTTEVYRLDDGSKEVTRTRSANKVTGRFGWINFNDPRTKISNASFLGKWYFPASS